MRRALLTLILCLASTGFAQAQECQLVPVTPKACDSPAAQPQQGASKLTQAQLDILAAKINALLAQGENARAFWGVEIASARDGRPIYEQNADRLFLPASNLKVATTIAALALLGPDYHTRTTVEAAAAPSADGVLQGDLALVGRGDANLSGRLIPYAYKSKPLPSLRYLEDLADQVVAHGVKQVTGDIVGDDSYFTFQPYPEGWAADDLMWDYGAPVSALTLNDNAIAITVLPGAHGGDKAVLRFDPDVPFYDIDNRVITGPPAARGTKAAGETAAGARNIAMDMRPGSRTLVLWGTIPLDDTGYTDSLAIEDPAEFAAAALRKLLEARGVKVTGKTRAHHLEMAALALVPPQQAASAASGATSADQTANQAATPGAASAANPLQVPAAAWPPITRTEPQQAQTNSTSGPQPVVLASHDSIPLAQDIVVTNKESENLHAELLLRAIGREKGAAPTLDEGLKVQKAFLQQVGVTPQEYAISDGSGLSRQDMVTPRAMLKLLRYADSQPWAQTFFSSLPIAGEDGTLGNRMKTNELLQRTIAKTGTLTHVNALSGFVTTAGGERLVFSILVNNHLLTAHGANSVIDKIMELVINMDAPEQPVPFNQRH